MSADPSPHIGHGPRPTALQSDLNQIVQAVSELRYGQVVVDVHGGTIVRIEKLERQRMLQRSRPIR